uniref:Uncharacterized protein n=1 Tax=Rhipicephalus zambeziensis TaxID=60191 RepID=A0A224YG20_9ACAR
MRLPGILARHGATLCQLRTMGTGLPFTAAWNTWLAFESKLRFSSMVEENVRRLRKILPAVATLASLADPSHGEVDVYLRPRLAKMALISEVSSVDIVGRALCGVTGRSWHAAKSPAKS